MASHFTFDAGQRQRYPSPEAAKIGPINHSTSWGGFFFGNTVGFTHEGKKYDRTKSRFFRGFQNWPRRSWKALIAPHCPACLPNATRRTLLSGAALCYKKISENNVPVCVAVLCVCPSAAQLRNLTHTYIYTQCVYIYIYTHWEHIWQGLNQKQTNK